MADFESIVKNHATEEGAIPASAINALTTAIKTAVGNEYVDKERYKAKLSEIDALKEKQQTAEDGATTAEKWKDKYTQVKKEFDDYKTSIADEKALAAKKAAYTDVCKDAGLNEKGVAKAVKYADWSSIELDDDGNVKDAKTHIKALREEWAEHVTVESVKGANTPNPPGNNGGGKTKDEIMSIKDPTERQKAIAENHELFGF